MAYSVLSSVSAVVSRFHLLKYGLAVILTFVGLKMIGERFVHIDIVPSLGIILGVLAIAITGSLIWPARPRAPRSAQPEEKTGSIFAGRSAREGKRAP